MMMWASPEHVRAELRRWLWYVDSMAEAPVGDYRGIP